ncbi:MAG: hypothetical protein KAI80_01160 [Hyphomicrobiaceae bacterium]|nr:hypothetical protein [Hyphomicrobiaceae bacterium]
MTSPEANLTDLFAEPNEIREALKAAFGGMNAYCSWWPTRDERGPRFSVSAQCRYGEVVSWQVAGQTVATWGDVLQAVGR